MHILNDSPDQRVLQVIEAQKKLHNVEVVRLYDNSTNYADVIDKIEQCDKVISWNNDMD